MQRDNFSYKNIINAVNIIKKQEGYISFYSGLTITIVVLVYFSKNGGGVGDNF